MKQSRNSLFPLDGLISEGRSFSAQLPDDLNSVAVGLEGLNPLLVSAACGVLALGLLCRLKEEL